MKSCHHCEYRIAGCHATCEAYATEKREHDEWVEMVRTNKHRIDDLNGVKIEAVEKYNKNRRFYR